MAGFCRVAYTESHGRPKWGDKTEGGGRGHRKGKLRSPICSALVIALSFSLIAWHADGEFGMLLEGTDYAFN